MALMDAAESLIAEHDSYAVPLREIVKRAGQKNESALQYHFGNLQGLVSAINERRWLEARENGEMLSALLQKRIPADDPRTLLVDGLPELARQRIDVATPLHSNFFPRTRENPFSAIEIANQFGGAERRATRHLRAALSHLDDDTFRHARTSPSAWDQP